MQRPSIQKLSEKPLQLTPHRYVLPVRLRTRKQTNEPVVVYRSVIQMNNYHSNIEQLYKNLKKGHGRVDGAKCTSSAVRICTNQMFVPSGLLLSTLLLEYIRS